MIVGFFRIQYLSGVVIIQRGIVFSTDQSKGTKLQVLNTAQLIGCFYIKGVYLVIEIVLLLFCHEFCP